MKRTIVCWALCVVAAVCNGGEEPQVTAALDENAQFQLLNAARRESEAGRRQEAIAQCDKIIETFRAHHEGSNKLVYSAITPAETLHYATLGATAGRDTVVLGPTWALAYMLKGAALIELGRVKEAREPIEAAVALSRQNPVFLSELGYVYQSEQHWEESLDVYQRAEAGVDIASREGFREKDLGRALRGQGFALTELGRIDEAVERYRRCLELNPQDEKARNEIRYIAQIREKQKAAAP